MTLKDLIVKATECGNKFNTFDIPLYGDNLYLLKDIDFEINQYDDGTYFINMNIKKS